MPIFPRVAAFSVPVTFMLLASWYFLSPSRVGSSNLPVSSPLYIDCCLSSLWAAIIWSLFALNGAAFLGASPAVAPADADDFFVDEPPFAYELGETGIFFWVSVNSTPNFSKV